MSNDTFVYVKLLDSSSDYLVKFINEFSFTECVLKNLSEFFTFYNTQLEDPKSNAVLITGQPEVGKTYFLKMLSILLKNDNGTDKENSLEYIKKINKLDNVSLRNIEKNKNISRDIILFNFNKDSFLNCLYSELNNLRGFCYTNPIVAYFEKELCLKNMFDNFKSEFKIITGEKWEKARDDFYFIYDEIMKSAINIGFLDENEAEEWFDNVQNYKFSIDEFCDEVNYYCKIKGDNHHIIYFIDELTTLIGNDIIEFQEIMDGISEKCLGNIFIIATSQLTLEKIDAKLSQLKLPNFTNIFETELFFDLENIIETIKLNLLIKKSHVEQELINKFNTNVMLFNSVYFEDFNIEKNDFVECYPFLNYQIELFIEILVNYFERDGFKGFINWGVGKYLYLNNCKTVLNEFADKKCGSLISFNLFFNVLILDSYQSKIFYNLKENKKITEFDLNILKIIFMLNFSDKINSTSKNLTTLMISDIEEDPFELNKKINKSLEKLLKENIIEKNDNLFNFVHD